jgi:hypothetical protein
VVQSPLPRLPLGALTSTAMIGDLVSIFVYVRSIERGFGANLKGTDPSDFGSSTDPDSDGGG